MLQVTYQVFVETYPSGNVTAHILELPGCFANGAHEAQALAYLQVAVPDYFRWLSMQDADTPTMSGEVALVVAERFTVTIEGMREVRAFFTPDAAPLSEDDLGWGLALMSYAHIDLQRLTRDLSIEQMDYQPDPQHRSITHIIDALAQNELWLAVRLEESPAIPFIGDLPGSPLARYDAIHEQAMLLISGATAEQRAVIREQHGERWSLRKVLRRSIQREREATEQIAILLGQMHSH